MKRARLLLTPELLATLLCFPDGCTILGPINTDGYIELIVEHDQLSDVSANQLPVVTAEFTRVEGEVQFMRWVSQ